MAHKKTWLSNNQIDQINYLYWEEGYDQKELGEMFGCYCGHVSRVVNGLVDGHFTTLAKKYNGLQKNIIPDSNEHHNAKILRNKREQLSSTKLSWEEVKDIRTLYFYGKITQCELSFKFKVNQSTISRIINGHKWKKV